MAPDPPDRLSEKEASPSAVGGALAIQGAAPSFPAGPPAWPVRDPEVDQTVMAALQDGSWGRYQADYSRRLVQKLCDLHGIEHAWTCCSGTFAVELALRGLQVRAGDEVILAGYDFPGNFRAVEAVGAFPVLVDIDPRTWCLDANQLRSAIGSKTSAVIVSHLHGGLADMQRITEIARAHHVGVIEDACQAPGAQVQDRMAGTWGDVGVLSFGGSKLLTAGRGGAILTGNASVYQRAKIFSERGNEAFPLSELQAAVLLPQLEKLPQRNQQRGENVRVLQRLCQGLTLLQPIATPDQGDVPSYYKVAFRYAGQLASVDREEFIAAVQAEGVALGPGFRGFLRRGSKRCRQASPLSHCAQAAANTMLLHHPALLQPPGYVQRVAQTLAKVAHAFTAH